MQQISVSSNFTELLMSFSSFLVVSLGFSVYSIMSYVNNNRFTMFQLKFFYFFFFSVVARTSKTTLNRNGGNGHPYPIPNLRGNAFIFLPLSRTFSSVQFSCSVVSDSLRPHESQHTRPPCPSPTPRVHSNPCPSSR